MTTCEDLLWFNISMLIVSIIFIGGSIANIVYYNRIREGTCGAVNDNEATAMIWINVILLVVGVLILLWSIWRLFFHNNKSNKHNKVISYSTVDYY